MNVVSAYLEARWEVVDAGYLDEIEWAATRDVEKVTEIEFLTEAAWVIINSGMRYQVARTKWPAISKAFLWFGSAKAVTLGAGPMTERALEVFAHKGKMRAIVEIAEMIVDQGFEAIHEKLRAGDIDYLETFPFIGPTTKYHLAKSMGIPVAKPDRHLVRLAEAAGFSDVQAFCGSIAEAVGDPVGVVDIVLWRFAEMTPGYMEWWNNALRGSG